MKVTALSIEFDGRDEQETINVTKVLKELLYGSSTDVSVETHVITPKKEEKPVGASKTTSTAAPTFSEPAKTAVPKKEKTIKAEEPAKEETKNEAPTLKEMQQLVISSVKTGNITRDEMASILLEFGGASLSKVNPSKYTLLKQRIENYHLTR